MIEVLCKTYTYEYGVETDAFFIYNLETIVGLLLVGRKK